MPPTAIEVVTAFNEAINAGDLTSLESLMTPGHRFIDSAGGTVEGREASVAAWSGFFESFPDYRNDFAAVELTGPGQVVVDGHSRCSFEPLDGPARWYATVEGDRVAVWRVEDPA